MAGEVQNAEAPTRTVKNRGGARAERKKKKKKKGLGEVAGGAVAECTAVCCCFPCTLMNLLVLAVFKVPACLCNKVKKRQRSLRRRKEKRQALLDPPSSRGSSIVEESKIGDGGNNSGDNNNEAVDFDKEMWDRFYGTGFWRSPSQKGT